MVSVGFIKGTCYTRWIFHLFTRETTFIASSLYLEHTSPFWKGVFYEKKEFVPLGKGVKDKNLLPLEANSILLE